MSSGSVSRADLGVAPGSAPAAAAASDDRPAIKVRGLVKSFGDVRALGGVDLDVARGTVLGLLGPNGAGKTTVVRVLTTLLKPDGGSAEVAGLDVIRDAARLRERIAGQYAAVDENLTGLENLTMVGRLYGAPRTSAKRRGAELLERFDLVEAGRRQTSTYSGGMRRRLDLAAALVAKPPVLFLDEPTTGLDPRSRISLWETIEGLVADGTTVLLTTQYLDEADRLANSITVIDHGHRSRSGDRPGNLGRAQGSRRGPAAGDRPRGRRRHRRGDSCPGADVRGEPDRSRADGQRERSHAQRGDRRGGAPARRGWGRSRRHLVAAPDAR